MYSIGYVRRMFARLVSLSSTTALLAIGLCLTAACSQFKMPRLTEAPPPQPTIPASVTLIFDESVRAATLEQTVCADTLWRGRLGDAIIQAFQETGRARFAQVTVKETSENPPPASSPSTTAVTAAIKLARTSLKTRTRTGSDDQYISQLEIQLGAAFQDANGKPLAEAPLVYSEQVKVYTPQYGGSGQCATQGLDEVMNQAAEHLAGQLTGYVAELTAKAQGKIPADKQLAGGPVPSATPMGPPGVLLPPPTPVAQEEKSPTSLGRDPNRYAVIVGLSLYRSPWPGWRDGLSFDGRETLSLFADALDVPAGQTLLLQDELAAQEDIEEALASWLPKRVSENSIVFVYFAGQALADAKTGEVYLIPYDSTPASSRSRLISLRFFQSRLQKLGAKLALALIDAPLTPGPASKDGKNRPPAPNWIGDLNRSSDAKAGALVQVARLARASDSQPGLLKGLTGPADLDHDGVVTVGEWLRSLRGTAVTAPALPPTLAVQSIPLSRVNTR